MTVPSLSPSETSDHNRDRRVSNGSPGKYISKRPHKKSRAGCLVCKERKVKVRRVDHIMLKEVLFEDVNKLGLYQSATKVDRNAHIVKNEGCNANTARRQIRRLPHPQRLTMIISNYWAIPKCTSLQLMFATIVQTWSYPMSLPVV